MNNGGAVISDCGAYRYTLWRRWDEALDRLVWVMLNPSTADAETDDMTIRKCTGFALRWGFGGIEVVNLFAYRATKPLDLRLAKDPVGPRNNTWLEKVLGVSPTVVAWGGSVPGGQLAGERFVLVRKLLAQSPLNAVWSLGRTQSGHPRHPSRLSYATQREPWPVT